MRLAQVKTDLEVRQNVLDDRKERQATVLTLESKISAFRAKLPDVTDSDWRQLLLDLGLTAEIKPKYKAIVRISVKFTNLMKQLIAQPMPQTGQLLGGVVYLRS